MLKRDVILRPLTALLAVMVVVLALAAPAKAQTPARADTTKAAAKAPKKAKAPKAVKPRLSAEEDRKQNGPWASRMNWLSLRAGYAKLSTETAGDGFVGYGLAYQRNLTPKYGFVASVHHEVVGVENAAKEIAVPMTVGFVRHLNWHTALRPYVGIGAGYYFHKYYRTGPDYGGAPQSGWYLNTGWNLPIDDRHLVGVDARMSLVDGRGGVSNAVFGPENESETQWSVKLNWALAY